MDLMAIFPREHRLKGLIFDYPAVVVAILVGYLAISLKLGPMFMRNRKPYNVRTIMRLYNIAQVLANLVSGGFAIHMMRRYWDSGLVTFPCVPPTTEIPDLEGEGDTELVAFLTKCYFYVRILDFLDTFLFVLTKKFSHISFLHVYHHFIAVATGYVYIRSGWGSILLYGVLLNAGVHVFMYSYYFLTTFPAMKPFLWWKPYLTIIQIVQFMVIGIHMVWVSVENCGFPPVLLYYNLIQIALFLILFAHFYVSKYVQKSEQCTIKGTLRNKSD